MVVSPESDWHTLHAAAPADSPGAVIRLRAARREAAARLARFMRPMRATVPLVPGAGSLRVTKVDAANGRVTIESTGAGHEWFDWDRLRVNVAHLVSPSTVRWR